MPSQFTTEQLLNNNPVNLERDASRDKDYKLRYLVRANVEPYCGIVIGGTYIEFWDDQKNLVYPTLNEEIRGLGFGLALYVAAERTSDDDGRDTVLTSVAQYLTADAERVWQSLIRRGLAEGERDIYNPYRFIR